MDKYVQKNEPAHGKLESSWACEPHIIMCDALITD